MSERTQGPLCTALCKRACRRRPCVGRPCVGRQVGALAPACGRVCAGGRGEWLCIDLHLHEGRWSLSSWSLSSGSLYRPAPRTCMSRENQKPCMALTTHGSAPQRPSSSFCGIPSEASAHTRQQENHRTCHRRRRRAVSVSVAAAPSTSRSRSRGVHVTVTVAAFVSQSQDLARLPQSVGVRT
jgi:hypothetical protein